MGGGIRLRVSTGFRYPAFEEYPVGNCDEKGVRSALFLKIRQHFQGEISSTPISLGQIYY